MPKLLIASKSVETVLSDEILETLLVEGGAAGKLPTSEKKLLKFLGLEQMSFDFDSELDFLETPQKPPGKLRAALHLGERVVATQSGMGEKRTRFSVFHEIAHCVLPEHHNKLFVDTDQTLSLWAKARMEREANRFAADLLFQGRLFAEEALSLKTSLRSIIGLAPKYGASFEAAFRRYTESHVVPCALVVYEKVHASDESYVEDEEFRVRYTVASPPFAKLYFSAVGMAEDTCKASELFQPKEFWRVGEIVENELVVDSNEKGKFRFETEVFSNGYNIFQFLRRPVSSKKK